MSKDFYKGYWMVTNRCNLRCTYCVLENAPHQLKAELDLNGKKELVSHLYNNFGFRRLTLSGGEVLIFGKHPPSEFIELLRHIRTFRSTDPSKNLEIELYTNGTYLTEAVAQEMKGVVDMVAVTIDGINNRFLTEIGRNHKGYNNYFDHIVKICSLITSKGIELKLHSVVGQKNHLLLPEEVTTILDAINVSRGHVSAWKFYQYMSYESPDCDTLHAIPSDFYQIFKNKVEEALKNRNIHLHFKDNQEMNASLFNILPYGNAQYMRDQDTWTTSQRTKDLRSYPSIREMFAQHDINEELYRKFHRVER